MVSKHFHLLPRTLREQILDATYSPKLLEVRIFGCSHADEVEMRLVQGFLRDNSMIKFLP